MGLFVNTFKRCEEQRIYEGNSLIILPNAGALVKVQQKSTRAVMLNIQSKVSIKIMKSI